MLKYAVLTMIVFLGSLIWLIAALSGDNQTHQWAPVEAKVLDSQMLRTVSGRASGIEVLILYNYEGQDYEAVLDDYVVGTTGTVFVNPADPTQVVGEQGPRVQSYGRPLIATLASGLFAIVLCLIAFSPKED
ncbi:MAG: DUF3592 domain-containing protein [Planctomycetota bacterium]